MSRPRAVPVSTRPPEPTHAPSADALDRVASRVVAELLDHFDRDPEPFPYQRVRDLISPRGPFSKAWIFARLREGRLRAVKLDGVLLIERASVRALLESAKPWRPR